MKLIVNADDFGYSKGVNLGIIEAHRHGIVSSATLMANMPGWEHAVQLAAEHPNLGVGIHLVLTCGTPVSSRLSSLIDEQGRFLRLPDLIRHAREEEVETEWTAQIEKCLAAGVKPTHLDSHHHVHAFEKFLPVISRLAQRYGLPVRNPWSQSPQARSLYPRLRTTDCFLHHFYGDDLSAEGLIRILQSTGDVETVELMCHPAYVDYQLLTGSGYVWQRVKELDILTALSAKKYLQEHDIQLITFQELG
ncbi:MAG: chitin disaccharide deacetylase [Brevibacillus sp.]|nr:chitin disaccharide deacetylase [Brevibacillus sp.]